MIDKDFEMTTLGQMIETIDDYQIKGVLPLGKDVYVFLNGRYLDNFSQDALNKEI